MSLRNASVWLGLSYGLVGCGSPKNAASTPGPQIVADTGTAYKPRSGGLASQQIANENPEFGGAFIADGMMNVYITDAGIRSGAEAGIRESIRRRRPNAKVRVLRGKFSYRLLQKYHEALGPFVGPRGVAGIGVSDRTNQLQIVVVDEATQIRLEKAIKRLGIDPSAVQIVRGKYVELTRTSG